MLFGAIHLFYVCDNFLVVRQIHPKMHVETIGTDSLCVYREGTNLMYKPNFWPFVKNEHLSVGLTEHNFSDNFVQNMINKLNGAIELHNNASHWHR